jgi:hypothetical protein
LGFLSRCVVDAKLGLFAASTTTRMWHIAHRAASCMRLLSGPLSPEALSLASCGVMAAPGRVSDRISWSVDPGLCIRAQASPRILPQRSHDPHANVIGPNTAEVGQAAPGEA